MDNELIEYAKDQLVEFENDFGFRKTSDQKDLEIECCRTIVVGSLRCYARYNISLITHEEMSPKLLICKRLLFMNKMDKKGDHNSKTPLVCVVSVNDREGFDNGLKVMSNFLRMVEGLDTKVLQVLNMLLGSSLVLKFSINIAKSVETHIRPSEKFRPHTITLASPSIAFALSLSFENHELFVIMGNGDVRTYDRLFPMKDWPKEEPIPAWRNEALSVIKVREQDFSVEIFKKFAKTAYAETI